jgi:hypothetical protein
MDRSTVTLHCPKYGRTGSANVLADDTFPLDELTLGFVIRGLGDTFGSTEIVCDTCHELATREISAAA